VAEGTAAGRGGCVRFTDRSQAAQELPRASVSRSGTIFLQQYEEFIRKPLS
jgi:hypothetical protein